MLCCCTDTYRTHCHSLLPQKNRLRTLVAGIALAALAAFTVGLLSILGTTGVANMGILNQINWYYGGLLMAVGCLLFLSCFRLPCLVFRHTFPKRVRVDGGLAETTENQVTRLGETDDKPIDPYKEVLDFLAIEPDAIDKRLESIYGENIPQIDTKPRSISEEDVADYKINLLLQLVANKRLSTILNFSILEGLGRNNLNLLFKRLVLCPPTVQPTQDWSDVESDPDTITLATLWSIRGDKISENMPEFMPDQIWGLLTSAQLNKLLENTCDEQLLAKLFPTDTQSAKKWTAYRFQHLSVDVLRKQLQNLSRNQLHLLPDHYILCDEFPLKKGLSLGGIYIFFEYAGEKWARSRALLEQIPFERVLKISEFFVVAQWSLIPEKYLKKESFPWQKLLEKKNFAYVLKWYPLTELPRVPWEEIAKNQEAIDVLFSLREDIEHEEEAKNRTIDLLNTLPLNVVRRVAPALSSRHLGAFKKERLTDPDFPWDIFIEKKGIGQEMRFLPDAREVLLAANIPWQILTYARDEKGIIKQPDLIVSDMEVKELFSFFEGMARYKLTDQLLNELRIDQIAVLAPALSKEHLLKFKMKRLEDPDFPWMEFLKKSGIGLQMRRLRDSKAKKNYAAIIAAASIPWGLCVKEQPHVIQDLFIINDVLSPDGTKNILNALKTKTIGIIAPLLTEAHLTLLEDIRFSEAKFPWSLILSKEKIAQLVRTLILKEIALPNFDWETFAENRTEIDKFFSTHEYRKDKTQKILNNLDLEVIKFLAQKGVLTETGHYALLDSDRKRAFKEV